MAGLSWKNLNPLSDMHFAPYKYLTGTGAVPQGFEPPVNIHRIKRRKFILLSLVPGEAIVSLPTFQV
jgi:hypothetical protein